MCTGLWCKKYFLMKAMVKKNTNKWLKSLIYSILNGLAPTYLFIIIFYMFLLSLLAPVLLGFLWFLNHVMLIFTKWFYIGYFSGLLQLPG